MIFPDCERCQEHPSLSCLLKEERNGFASSLSFSWCSGCPLLPLHNQNLHHQNDHNHYFLQHPFPCGSRVHALSFNNFYFHSIVSLVAVIYCIVIIYLPSLIEAETNFVVCHLPLFLITITGLVLQFLWIWGREIWFKKSGCCRDQSGALQQRLIGTSPTPFR